MKNLKIKSYSLLIISVFILGIIANSYFVGASLPESSQEYGSLDVDGHPVLVNNNGVTSTVNTEDASIDMTGATSADPTGDIRIDGVDSHDYGLNLSNFGDFGLYDPLTDLPYANWNADPSGNMTNLDLYGEGLMGNIFTDINSNYHLINDYANEMDVYLGMDNGLFQFSDLFQTTNNIQLLFTPAEIILLFGGYTNANLSISNIGDITWGPTLILPGGLDGEAQPDFGGVIPGGVNISRHFGVITIQFRGIIITFTETDIVPGTSLDISVNYFNIFLVSFFNCWDWFFTGYILFGWYFYGSWIWLTFYVNWIIFELIYVFIWEYTGIKIEYYYTEIIYIVVTWYSVTIIVWYYIDIIIWEFKYIINFWIFHWTIIWNQLLMVWQWNFWFFYIHWILPVIIVTVPILYIPPVVDIDVQKESYDAAQDILDLEYFLKDLYGTPVTTATVTVNIDGIDYPATSKGDGSYNVSISNVEIVDLILITVSAIVPFVALVDTLTYNLEIGEEECLCPNCPDTTIPTFPPSMLVLFSGIAVLGIAAAILKKRKAKF